MKTVSSDLPPPLPAASARQALPLSTGRSLAAVHDAIVNCERCPRLRQYCARVAHEKKRAHRGDTYWGRPVPGFGDADARMLVLALAPAAHGANRTGRVFTGDAGGGSGDFLMAALHRTGFANIPTSQRPDDGLRLTDAYILSAVRCAPPDNKPLPEEITRCLDHLEAELAELPRIRVVVALGKIGFDAWLQLLRRRGVAPRPRPQFAHGTIVWMGDGLPVLVGSYHPSRQNTNTGKLDAKMMVSLFNTAKRMIGGPALNAEAHPPRPASAGGGDRSTRTARRPRQG